MSKTKKITEKNSIPIEKISISSFPDSIPTRTAEEALLYELFLGACRKSTKESMVVILPEWQECTSEEAQKASPEKTMDLLRDVLYEHFKVNIAFAKGELPPVKK